MSISKIPLKENETLIDKMEEAIGKQQALPVVDQEAYNEYLRLSKNPLLNEKKMQLCSDGKYYNIAKMPHHLQEDIKHLPIDEQKKMMSLKKVYFSLNNKRTGLLRRAHGANVKGNGEQATNHRLKVLDVKKAELIELFGRMFSSSEVHELVLKTWKLNVNKDTLIEWRKAHQDEVNIRIEEHKRTYSDIRLSHKRSRLEELSWLYTQRKAIYNMTKKGDDHRLLLQTIEAIKREVEGDRIVFDGQMNINLEATIDGHVKNEILSHISILEIVLARVAAKTGIDPVGLIKNVSDGFYFNKLYAEDVDHEEVKAYPSAQVYDFDRITRINKQRDEQKQIQKVNGLTSIKKPNPVDVQLGQEIKDILMKRIQEKVGDVNYAKNSLNGDFIDQANKM